MKEDDITELNQNKFQNSFTKNMFSLCRKLSTFKSTFEMVVSRNLKSHEITE